jgi:NADPH-dependent 2,4-dienoyl-CoA reductase/sulfur reductase-like enzyme
MVFPEEYLLSRLFTRDLAQFYEDFYAAKGIKLMKRAKVTAVEGEGGKVGAGPYWVWERGMGCCHMPVACGSMLGRCQLHQHHVEPYACGNCVHVHV